MADIAFEQIPESTLVPLWYAEVVPGFSPVNSTLKVLLVGHRCATGFGLPAGSGEDLTPYILSSSNVNDLFGRGSMIAAMYRAARRNAPFVELWGIAAVPDGGGVQAVGSITVSTIPTQNGTINMLIGGERFQCLVKSTDTKASLALRMQKLLNKSPGLPVKAVINGVDPAKIDLTCRWAGASGNRIQITSSVFGYNNWESRQLLTIVQLATGAGTNLLTPVFAAIGDQPFDVISVGFAANSTLLNEADALMDGVSGRWSPYRQLYGHVIMTEFTDYSGLITLGTPRNGPHVSVMGVNFSLSPTWQWSAAISAVIAQHFAAPPELSRPEQTLELVGILPPNNPTNWFDIEERQALLEQSISTFKVDPDRTVRLDRLVTTYKTDVWGDPDGSWRDAVTMFQTMYFVRSMRAAIRGAFPRAALTDTDTGIPGFASPGTIKDVFIHNYRNLESVGLVENTLLFAEHLIVQRNSINANRVDAYMPIDVVNQLRTVAALVETNLEFDKTL